MSGALFYLVLFVVTCTFGRFTRGSRRCSAPQTAHAERQRTMLRWH